VFKEGEGQLLKVFTMASSFSLMAGARESGAEGGMAGQRSSGQRIN